jgi:hypothetical protein
VVKGDPGDARTQLQHPEYDELDISPPKNLKAPAEGQSLIGNLGKRLSRSFKEQHRDQSSDHESDDEMPFGGADGMVGILGSTESKPYRTVIKRYWTEEEVNKKKGDLNL